MCAHAHARNWFYRLSTSDDCRKTFFAKISQNVYKDFGKSLQRIENRLLRTYAKFLIYYLFANSIVTLR